MFLFNCFVCKLFGQQNYVIFYYYVVLYLIVTMRINGRSISRSELIMHEDLANFVIYSKNTFYTKLYT